MNVLISCHSAWMFRCPIYVTCYTGLDRTSKQSPPSNIFCQFFQRQRSISLKELNSYIPENVVHRDLKPGNVLVSNKHYTRPEVTKHQLEDLFINEPLVCKLTDFGESRSLLLQTSAIIHAQTSNIERGTKPYMAPEIVLESRKLASATLEDMKAMDVWAFGMTLFSILNPDTSFPFEIELKSTFPTTASGPAQFQTLLQDKMEGKTETYLFTQISSLSSLTVD